MNVIQSLYAQYMANIAVKYSFQNYLNHKKGTSGASFLSPFEHGISAEMVVFQPEHKSFTSA